MICGSGGSKSRLAKAAGAEPAGQVRDEKLHAVVARSTFWSQNVQNTSAPDHFWRFRCRKSARRCGAKHILKVKMYKAHHSRTTFGSWDVEKVHAVVARSTFPSQNVQNTPCSDHFWKLRCRKSARRCGAKHIPSQNVQNTTCSRHFWSWDVEKVHAVVARSTFPSQNVQNTTCSPHFWRFGCRFTTLHYTTLRSTTLHYITLHYIPVHYMTLHYTPVHSMHCTKLHYTTLHYTTLRSTTLHYTISHYTTLHSTTLHYTILHYLPPHFTTLPTLHYPLHYNYNYN